MRNPQLLQSVLAEAAKHINEQALFAAQAAAAVMGMNNVFYRFRHLSTNPKYGDDARAPPHAGHRQTQQRSCRF